MSVILVVEPDAAQAALLSETLPDRVGAELAVASSCEEATAALNGRVPDLLLFGRDVSPEEQARVLGALSPVADPATILTHQIPELRTADVRPRQSGLFGFRKSAAAVAESPGWDPTLFAEQIAAHLERALRRRNVTESAAPPAAGSSELDAEARAFPDVSGAATPGSDATNAAVSDDWSPVDGPPADAAALLQIAEWSVLDRLDETTATVGEDRALRAAPRADDPWASPEPWDRALELAPGDGSATHGMAEPEPFHSVDPGLTGLRSADPPADALLDVAPREAVESGALVTDESVFDADVNESASEDIVFPNPQAQGGTPESSPWTVPEPADVAAFEVDALIDQLGVDPMAIEVEAPEPATEDSLELEEDEIAISLDEEAGESGLIDAEVHAAELALAEVRAEARLTSELERVRTEAAERHAEEVARLEAEAAASRQTAVQEARAAAEAEARAALATELAKVRAEAESKLTSELARVRQDAERNVTEQVGRTKAEADRVLEEELGRAQAEADLVRAAAVEEARAAAEATAARAMASETERVRGETEARLEAELVRLREEAEQARLAHQQAQREAEHTRAVAAREARDAAEHDAARALEVEVARIKAESDARLEAEILRVRQEAEEHRRAASDLDPRENRSGASVDGAGPAHVTSDVDQEVARVKAEADARLYEELARVQEEAAQARRARDEAQVRAEHVRQAAARAAREAAEQSAARALAAESARLRAEAEARVAADTERVRAEAQTRLRSEIAAFTLEAERRRKVELQEIRDQVFRLRNTAAFDTGAERAGAARQRGARWSVESRSQEDRRRHTSWPARAAAAALVVASLAYVVDLPGVLRSTIESARTAPDAVDLASDPPLPVDVPAQAPPPARPRPERPQARAAPAQSSAVPVESSATTADPSSSRPEGGVEPSGTSSVAPTRAVPDASGFLSVFSRIPVEVYLGNRRIGSSDETQILMPAGWHRLGLVSNRFNYQSEITLEIVPGDVTAFTVTLPDGPLRIHTTAGAQVWVENHYIGTAPVGDILAPIGTREVVVRHPDYGVRRAVVEVKHDIMAEVTLMLERAVDGQPSSPAVPQLPPLSRPPAPRPR
jgi:hypothetical protein